MMKKQEPPLEELPPWLDEPSEWFKYLCRSCNYTEWVQDIVVYGFPPEKPKGTPVLDCRECGGELAHPPSEPVILSKTDPNVVP